MRSLFQQMYDVTQSTAPIAQMTEDFNKTVNVTPEKSATVTKPFSIPVWAIGLALVGIYFLFPLPKR